MHTNPPGRVRRWINDALIIVGISIGIILVCEVFLRVLFPQNLVGKSISGKRFSVRDKVLGMRYIPGAIWRFTHPEYEAEYSINEDGFRDAKDHATRKPVNTTRVLLLGDSFTFGQGVNYEEIWSVIVEKRLKDSGMNNIELVKAGIQGMDTRSEFVLMQRLFEKYQYDIVIVVFLINDLFTNDLYGIEETQVKSRINEVDQEVSVKKGASAAYLYNSVKRLTTPSKRNTTFHLLTLARRIASVSEAVYCKLYYASANRREFLTIPLSSKLEEKLTITEALFEKMADYVHDIGKRLIVLSIPQQSQVLCSDQSLKSRGIDVTFYDGHFFNFAKNNGGLTWVTTFDAFNESNYDKDELFYRLDGHLTPAGNHVVADVFVREVIPLISER